MRTLSGSLNLAETHYGSSHSFDIVELSAGFLSFPPDDWLRLIEQVQSHGLIPKSELGIQFGAGGDTDIAQLESTGTSDHLKASALEINFWMLAWSVS